MTTFGRKAASRVARATPAHIPAGTCVVAIEGEDLCGQDALPGAPWPACTRHALDMYRHVASLMTDRTINVPSLVRTLVEFDANGGKRAGQARPDVMNGWPSVVYYLQLGELIKIGRTTRLIPRIRQYPPTARLLAVEPGADAVEQRRKEQFVHLLAARNEWFRLGPELMAHVGQLAADGLPPAPRAS